MPIYKYQCYECGLEFEEMRSLSARETCPCISCEGEAKKQVSSGNFTFQHKPTGAVPQNTGVASIDYDFDKTIGRDAEQKWKTIDQRRSDKVAFIERERRKGNQIDMAHVTKTPDGGFRALSNPEIQKANENRNIASDYNRELYNKHKSEDSKKPK
jgi:putative FmdB family regulatory protein